MHNKESPVYTLVHQSANRTWFSCLVFAARILSDAEATCRSVHTLQRGAQELMDPDTAWFSGADTLSTPLGWCTNGSNVGKLVSFHQHCVMRRHTGVVHGSGPPAAGYTGSAGARQERLLPAATGAGARCAHHRVQRCALQRPGLRGRPARRGWVHASAHLPYLFRALLSSMCMLCFCASAAK